LAIGYDGQAARLAYQAQFHAARALIFEQTNKMAKTHKGVRALFHQLIKDNPTLRPVGAGGLTSSYQFKESVDYETGVAAFVSREDAEDTIATAKVFVGPIRRALFAT
jgi:uncharacterized protein (UPF0332 family)